MQLLNLKPNHKSVTAYYQSLGKFDQINIFNESAVKVAFQNLLETCGRQFDWSLVLEWTIKRPKLKPLRVDGAVVDAFKLTHGFWEAKDEHDDLGKEARAKLELGYPKDNILFQSPKRAILYQNGRLVLDEDITKPENLVGTLKHFFEYLPRSICS